MTGRTMDAPTSRSGRVQNTLSQPTPSKGNPSPDIHAGPKDRSWMTAVGTFAVLLSVWSFATYDGRVAPEVLPSPTALIAHFGLLYTKGYLTVPLWDHIQISLMRTFTGFTLAVILGVPTGVAMGHFKMLNHALRPILSFLRPIPPIAFIPLAVLYLGLGELPKIILIFYASFIFVTINAEAGARSTSQLLLRAAQTMSLSRAAIFWRVVMPSALPSILAGMRVALAVSWGVVVAAELIAAQSGLGYMVSNAGALFDLKTVYVGIICIGIIGMMLDAMIVMTQRRLLHWQGK